MSNACEFDPFSETYLLFSEAYKILHTNDSAKEKMFLKNFTSSRDGPGKSTETMQR